MAPKEVNGGRGPRHPFPRLRRHLRPSRSHVFRPRAPLVDRCGDVACGAVGDAGAGASRRRSIRPTKGIDGSANMVWSGLAPACRMAIVRSCGMATE